VFWCTLLIYLNKDNHIKDMTCQQASRRLGPEKYALSFQCLQQNNAEILTIWHRIFLEEKKIQLDTAV